MKKYNTIVKFDFGHIVIHDLKSITKQQETALVKLVNNAFWSIKTDCDTCRYYPCAESGTGSVFEKASKGTCADHPVNI